jgi:dynein intermediate chain
MVDQGMQTLSIGNLTTVYESEGVDVELPPKRETEVITYSKGVQADIDWSPRKTRGAGESGSERDDSPTRSPRTPKRMSRRQKERDEEIRLQLKKEIEDEIKAAQKVAEAGEVQTASGENYPFKTLSNEELTAVENSGDFIDFVERSTKVLERALDQQLDYDILADYALGGASVDDEDEGYGSSGGKKGRRIKEIAQFWDERWSKKRMISDLGFSTKVRVPLHIHLAICSQCACSSPNLSLPPTRRILPLRMIQMASFRCGISICTTDQSTFSTPNPTF